MCPIDTVFRAEQSLVQSYQHPPVHLAATGRPVIPLADEINLLQAYLDIQQIRFRDRLTVTMEVPRELERAAVPNLILQPLVENAIKHGAARQVGPTTIRVAVWRAGDELALEVSNTGSPNGRPPQLVEGMGMRNTKERLAERRGGDHPDSPRRRG